MIMMAMIIIIMPHECIWRTIGGISGIQERERKEILKGEEDRSMLHVKTAQ
jgi:hypothetical protein